MLEQRELMEFMQVLKTSARERATGIIGLRKVTYNLFRFEQITRLKIS